MIYIKKILLVNLLICSLTPSFAQLIIKGKVLEKANEKTVSYVNIGVLNSTIGTISNSDGSFSITISAAHLEENLLFSAIGYEIITIAVKSIVPNKEVVIYLNEKVIYLDEVVISASTEKMKEKHSWLGHGKRHLMVQGQMFMDSISAGGALALLVEKKDDFDLQFIDKARLFITRNTEPEFKVRVRFLEVDSTNNNLPGRDLFNESIVITSDIKRGWLTFDLSSYNITIAEESFFLVFEWILEDKVRVKMFNTLAEYGKLNPNKIIRDTVIIDGKKVPISDFSSRAQIPVIAFGDTRTKSDLENYKCYSRGNSFGEWKRATGIVSAKILMSNKPTRNSILSDDDVIVSDNEDANQEETLDSKIGKWGDAFIEYYATPGMQLSVSSKKKTLFSKGFGYSDVENEKKVNPQTRFRIASVTKPITSAAMIKLASEGKLDMDVDVRTYVPSFPEKKYTLTTRQLAGHLGGIRDYYEISLNELFNNPHFETATEAISIFKNDTLMSKPGNEFLYSSYGYDLLGAVIEGASGESYLDYMQHNIWKPLLMSNTYGDISDSTIINKSKFYYPNEEEASPYDLSYGYPSGGLISTTEDLLRFGNELLYGSFFEDRFKNKLFETQYTTDKNLTNYGLGWYIGKDINGHRIWYHVGELPSTGAVLILYPDDGIVISLLTNTPILTNALNGLPMEVQKLGGLIYKD